MNNFIVFFRKRFHMLNITKAAFVFYRCSKAVSHIHFESQMAFIIEGSLICGSFMSDIGCCRQRSQLHSFEGNVC